MPRNSNGQYTLPAGNPVVSGEVISTSWANPTMEDIAAEMTNSLDRNGRGGMLAPFKNADGTQSNPGMTWGNEPTTGFYRNAAQDMRAVVGGFPRMRWDANGVQLWNGTIWSPVVTDATLDTALTAKGYAVKAADETISGTWTFTGGALVAPGIVRRAAAADRLVLVGGLDTGAGVEPRIDLNGSAYSSGPGKISLRPVTGASVDVYGNTILQNGASLTLQGGNVNVTGNGTFSGTGAFASNLTIGGTASAGEKPVKFRNDILTAGIDLLLSSAADTFGVYRRDSSAWVWQYTLATGAHVFTGSLNATLGLFSGGNAVAIASRTLTGTNSIAGGGDLTANRTFQLVNDAANPGSSWYYGTDAAGTKGWFPLSGVVGVPEAPVDGNAYARQNASWVSIGSGGVYVLKTGDTMSGTLTISNAEPQIVWNEGDAPADEKIWRWVHASGNFYLQTRSDANGTGVNALSFLRTGVDTTQVGMVGTNISLGAQATYVPPLTSGHSAGVISTGIASVGCYGFSGGNNGRVALYADQTTVGIDWTYSSGVTGFHFKRTGITAFSYDQTNLVTYGLVFNLRSPNGVDGINFGAPANGGSNAFMSPAGACTNLQSTINMQFVGGKTLGFYGENNTTIATYKVDSNGVAYWNSDATLTGYQWYLNNVLKAHLNSASLLLGAGVTLNIFEPNGNYGATISAQTTPGGVYYASNATYPQHFQIDGNTRFSVYPTYVIVPSGNAVYCGAAAISNYTGGSRGALIARDANAWHGGIAYWEDAGLYNGLMRITTTTPAATDEPGTIVLVYE